jgi:glyoxylase-like metal-dependent hydrolase (beta-lactamase superfamily II)
MLRNLFCPGLLDTGPVSDMLMVVRDGMVNFYILKSPGGLICIDSGWRPACVAKGFVELALNIRDVTAVFLTHLHWDHARSLPLFAHAEIFVGDQELPSFFIKKYIETRHMKLVNGNQTLSVGGLTIIRVIETPGHTTGAVSYVIDDNLLFTGDTLRLKCGKVLPFLSWFNKDEKILHHSIRKLAGIKGIECLLTAHNGMSRDVENAFAEWGQSADDSRSRGCNS